nr:hypothetical protein [Bacteroidota bacterium]
MSRVAHKLFIIVLSLIVILILIALIYNGFSYYQTILEERFFHGDHKLLKPSGILGHGLGIFGSLFMIIGVFSYMARKRYRFLSRMGLLKHWLEFHIFLCTLGPILILFHTSFKFGGLVAISFWSMVAVFLSGIIGRFIYLQIPRTIEGRELSLNEVRDMKSDIGEVIKTDYDIDDESYKSIIESTKKRVGLYHKNAIVSYFKSWIENRRTLHNVKVALKKNRLSRVQYKKVIGLVKNEISLNRKIERLTTMQNLFKYWHVAHLPFALVMLVIMIIHIGVTIVFGYKWIF